MHQRSIHRLPAPIPDDLIQICGILIVVAATGVILLTQACYRQRLVRSLHTRAIAEIVAGVVIVDVGAV